MANLEAKINKATDPALTGDNWQYILDVCDTISADPEVNTKAAIKIIKAKLNQKDANIMLRALTLLVATGENCGSRMQQEIASTAFVKEVLLSKLADKKSHKELKFRVAEVIEQLNTSFKSDPSLKAISDAYSTVKARYPQYLKSPPSKPAKTELTDQDRRKEDQELERALSLSVQEYEREQSLRKSYLNSKPLPGTQNNASSEAREAQTQASIAQPQYTGFNQTSTAPSEITQSANDDSDTITIANVKKVCALYDLISYEPDELSFRKGDIITVVESVYRDWWRGTLPNGKTGIFPLNYVKPVVSKSPEELTRERKMEQALMDIESKKVDKLLALLSSHPDSVSEEEVTDLYNSIVPLKPILAKLIGKHDSRKDELRALHDQLNAETKIYNNTIDDMIAMRQQNPQHYSLPYPSQNDRESQRPSSSYGNYLEQQPTSSGFGNANTTGSYQTRPEYQGNYQPANSAYPPPTSFPQRPDYA